VEVEPPFDGSPLMRDGHSAVESEKPTDPGVDGAFGPVGGPADPASCVLGLQVGEQVSGLREFCKEAACPAQVGVGVPPCLSWSDPPGNQGTFFHGFQIGAFGGQVTVELAPVIQCLQPDKGSVLGANTAGCFPKGPVALFPRPCAGYLLVK